MVNRHKTKGKDGGLRSVPNKGGGKKRRIGWETDKRRMYDYSQHVRRPDHKNKTKQNKKRT